MNERRHDLTDAEALALKKILPTGRIGDRKVGPFVVDRCGVDPAVAAALAARGLCETWERRPSRDRVVTFIQIRSDGEAAYAAWRKAQK